MGSSIALDSERRVVRETLDGLFSARRLVPILLVTTPLLVAQSHLSLPPQAFLLGAAMCAAFVFIAPVSFRLLFPDGLQASFSFERLVLYAAIGAASVLSIGAIVPAALHIGATFMTARPALAVCLALFLVGGWGLGRDIEFERSLARERGRAQALAREAERAELLAIRAQLDPHFLFNTLNAIAEWCREDGIVAERAVLQLSSILRTILDGVKVSAWPMERELEIIDTFFALHRLRDPDLFDARVVVAPETARLLVLPLVLLPLVENAVKHGPARGHRGTILIKTEMDESRLRVLIDNPGGYAGRRSGGRGLEMVERRLALAYAGQAALRIHGLDSGGTRVEVLLPAVGPEGGGPA